MGGGGGVLLPCLTGCLSFSLPYLSLPLPISLPCLFPWPAHAYFLLPMPYSYAYFLCLLPVSLPCLLLCPACFLALPFSLPCLFPCPAYFRALPIDLLFYECTLHGFIASLSLLIRYVLNWVFLFLFIDLLAFTVFYSFKNIIDFY